MEITWNGWNISYLGLSFIAEMKMYLEANYKKKKNISLTKKNPYAVWKNQTWLKYRIYYEF